MATAAELGLAFGLVLAAGSATAVGAAAVFFTNQANHKMLAASLGVSAGVMLYVSFMEIFAAKSVQGFENAGFTAAESTRYATLSFFAGMMLLWLLDKLVHGLLHLIGGKGAANRDTPTAILTDNGKGQPLLVTLQQVTQGPPKGTFTPASGAPPTAAGTKPALKPVASADNADTPNNASANATQAAGATVELSEIRVASLTKAGSSRPSSLVHRHPLQQQPGGMVAGAPSSGAYCMVVPELTGAEVAAQVVLRMHEVAASRRHPEGGLGRASHVAGTTMAVLAEEMTAASECQGEGGGARLMGAGNGDAEGAVGQQGRDDDDAMSSTSRLEKLHRDRKHQAKLSRMGLLAALAISLHNLPEGLATFVGALADPTAGVIIAIAIALHNIPEGVVVAMPIAFASGSKWKGFFWGCLSGATEPIGALLGFAILGGGTSDLNPLVYALLFGLVAGMMVWISVSELLPTAFRYDPDDHITTWAVALGMVIIAASLLLFEVK